MQEKLKRGLGRGLDALLPPSEGGGKKIVEVETAKLKVSKNQPRSVIKEEKIDELVTSIKEHGILQPIIARPVGEGFYEIIAGERRWRAAQKAGLHTVPVIVKDIEDLKMFEIALVENIQREDLNPIELAKAYKALIDQFDLTQEELSAKIGKDRATIANTIRLLSLPPSVQKALYEDLITFGHAKAILSIKGKENQERALLEVIKKGLSVRETEKLSVAKEKKIEKSRKIDPDTQAAENEMKKKLGLKVSINRKGKGGVVKIFFSSEDDLNHIWEWICRFGGRRQ
ncbi:MAG: ParB/RepB/Spo0J family partition protein [Thermoanaerobaculaceae bacterium]|nr:ParB/RepB/Spo0J family partition protein [Thermoanaerobaculaceae bacterium]